MNLNKKNLKFSIVIWTQGLPRTIIQIFLTSHFNKKVQKGTISNTGIIQQCYLYFSECNNAFYIKNLLCKKELSNYLKNAKIWRMNFIMIARLASLVSGLLKIFCFVHNGCFCSQFFWNMSFEKNMLKRRQIVHKLCKELKWRL